MEVVKPWVWQDRKMRAARPAPSAVDEDSSLAGLRTIAFFEALKGAAVILLMFILFLVHSRMDELAESLLYHLHMDPDKRIAQAFLNAASRLGDVRLLTIAAAAISYASVRFIESWGLWHRRVWAEWFALLSGTLYLPWEVARLIEHRTLLHAGILLLNLIIIGYMLAVRVRSCRPERNPAQLIEPAAK
jgi:uncharacterized membrane protein (DUF2068 family)